MTNSVLALDDAACQDVAVAGAKAAGLSRARSLGLPVLPGVVVTTSAALPAVAAGNAALAIRGSGGARLAAQSAEISPELVARLTAVGEELDAPLIARSSATVEADAEWSGAFSTFADLDTASVVTAVKGCWTSLFSVDALERSEHAGIPAEQIGMAVLLQPMLTPRVSGHAWLMPGGVRITAVEGSPAGLMSGWVSGSSATVTPSGLVTGDALDLLTQDEARAVAAVVDRCAALLDHDAIEWAIADQEVVLLQSSATRRSEEPRAVVGIATLAELDDPRADRVAQLVRRFPGGLSEVAVLPWALGVPDPRVLDEITTPAAEAVDLAILRGQAAELAELVWEGSRGGAQPWRRALSELRSDHPGAALQILDELRPPPYGVVVALMRSLLALGEQAVGQGSLRRCEEVFGCAIPDVEPTRTLHLRQSWAGPRRWEPFLAAVAQTRGTSLAGLGVSGGVGAGPARVVTHVDPAMGHATHARSVVVAEHPVPGLAPLLWNAAALVTTRGSDGAHLVEVARSLGVPTVVQCHELDLDRLGPDVIVAVDGDVGEVSCHDLRQRSVDRTPLVG